MQKLFEIEVIELCYVNYLKGIWPFYLCLSGTPYRFCAELTNLVMLDKHSTKRERARESHTYTRTSIS